jgi:hypothetical protein
MLIGLCWWIRNLSLYGWPDFLALSRHAEVVKGQPLTAAWLAEHGIGAYWVRAFKQTFQSFWGQFGWMALPMPGWVYICLLLTTCGALLGWCHLITHRSNVPLKQDGLRSSGAGLLYLALLFSALAYAGYNLTFVQHQGRYLFPALIPIACLLAAGLDGFLVSGLLLRGAMIAAAGCISLLALHYLKGTATPESIFAAGLVATIWRQLNRASAPWRVRLLLLAYGSLALLAIGALMVWIVPAFSHH